ncbi:MAG: right-handed parallel beta-helix repeat-containing protein [Oscillospiraceae bacterium]|jgi:hypothetical protein|nr:right-handed parallel beta-helix repeat-containing protein [Oscillospiraceae bacterium]
MKPKTLPTASLIALIAAFTGLFPWYWDVFVNWQPAVYPWVSVLLMLGAVLLTLVYYWVREPKAALREVLLGTAVSAAVFALVLFAFTGLINLGLGLGGETAANSMLPLNVLQVLVLSVLTIRQLLQGKRKALSVLLSVSVCILATALTVGGLFMPYYYNHRYKAPIPDFPTAANPVAVVPPEAFSERTIWVSPDGDDGNAGTKEEPLATVAKALEFVRSRLIAARAVNAPSAVKLLSENTIALLPGEYRVEPIVIDASMGKLTIAGTVGANGERAILTGAMSLSPTDFQAVTDEAVRSRLSAEAKENVRVIDLTGLGLTAADWGEMTAIGSCNTAARYTGGKTGALPCELFVNDTRQIIARYPNSGFAATGAKVRDFYTEGGTFDDNEPGDIFKADSEVVRRAAAYESLADVWMMGWWRYDWADASTPLAAADTEAGTLESVYASNYGLRDEGAPFYIYNAMEELDSPGEWYLDRESGLLYFYPEAGFDSAKTDLTLLTEPLIRVSASGYADAASFADWYGSDYSVFTLSGVTLQGTRGDGIVIAGHNCTVQHCIIKNTAGWAVTAEGNNILVEDCEITRTGMGGIRLSGGERESLTPGNNRAVRNLIHDWSEIYRTYQPAVSLAGVGNSCVHNEMYNSPHEAVTWSGNNHTISSNIIHDVCLLSDDAGAVYSGRRWDWYGTVISGNAIYNLGSGGHTPDGIYLDDALSGHTVSDNLLINVPKYALHLGGGRDLTVTGNIIINAGYPVSYDQRARDGALDQTSWFTHSSQKDGDMWKNLADSPWQTDVWQTAFPQYKHWSDDFADTDNPDFAPNPAYSTLTGNTIYDYDKDSLGRISEGAQRFSTIADNTFHSVIGMTADAWEGFAFSECGRVTGESDPAA